MRIIESVRDYISECPIFGGHKININYLGDELPSFSLEQLAAEPLIKRYCDGEELRQGCFMLAIRDSYDENDVQNIFAAKLLEDFADWLENGDINFCESEEGRVLKFEVIKTGSVCDTSYGSARYELQFRVVYLS